MAMLSTPGSLFLRLLRAVLVLVLSVAGARAEAQFCRATAPSGNYGNVNILASAPVSTTATFAVNCSGLAGRKIRLCVDLSVGTSLNNAQGSRALASGSHYMLHDIFVNAAHSQLWGAWSDATGLRPYGTGGVQRDITLNNRGRARQLFTLYGRVAGNQPRLPPGSYLWKANSPALTYYYASATSPGCPSGTLHFLGLTNSDVWRATILPNCLLSASDVNFGAVGSLSPGVSAVGAIKATCTNTTAFTLSLNNGLSPAATGPTTRKMTLGANSITYGLYRDSAHRLPFGSTAGVNTRGGTGTGQAQSIPVYGFVPPQATPPVGNYSDTIVVTLTY